jgi:TolB-like protein
MMVGQMKDGPTEVAVIQDELARVLSSQTFRRAGRMRELLDYVVKGTLEGVALTEAKAAQDVFHKDANFDARIDPEVRIQYGRLRRKLAEYYATEGKESPLMIDLPARQYGPVFVTKSEERPTTGEPSADQPEPELQSIAVLPFANLTNDPLHDIFCYGLTEEIISSLAAKPAVSVVASSSVFQFKDKPVDVREAGEELGVQMILEGSVRMEDDQTRVMVRLARVSDGIAVWSDSFDTKLDGSLNTQQDVARKIIESLPELNVERQTPPEEKLTEGGDSTGS